jgi:hypothetical protein
MLIVILSILIVLIVVGIHSYAQRNAPREPFYIDIEEEG